MRPVREAAEPPGFDAAVRQRGLDAIRELVGEKPLNVRPGRRRAKVADAREEIPPDKFPTFWIEATDDLLTAFERICSYVCVYIERVTGASSVDHMVPKSRAWDQVYEWSNYRLACSLMNSRKSNVSHVLDPFDVQPGWFELETTEFQLKPGPGLAPEVKKRVQDTIDQLGLNDRDCRQLRCDHAAEYLDGHVSFDFLTRHSPLVASELARQNRLRTP